MEPVYLDYAASNPVDPRVREAVDESLALVGNPSSGHSFGRASREAIDRSRSAVAELLGVEVGEIIFTSGATEANSLALWGYFSHLRQVHGPEAELRLAVSPLEHSSVRAIVARLETDLDVRVDTLPVDADGVIDLSDDLKGCLHERTAMVCVMWANNVLGSVQPLAEIGRLVADTRSLRPTDGLPLVLMSDAVQALRTEEVRPRAAGVDLLTLSGHKLYGPKGCGTLYARRWVKLLSQVPGGGQESGLRGGTENLPGIVGLGRAAELLSEERSQDRERLVGLAAQLRNGLREIDSLTLYGDPSRTLPGTIFVAADGMSGEELALKLDVAGLSVSTGSACETGLRKAPSVLASVCRGSALKLGGIRISLGRFTKPADIDRLLTELQRLLSNSR